MLTAPDDLATRLLEYLRRHLGQPGLEYQHQPRRMARGLVAEVWSLALREAPEQSSGSLVLRLYPGGTDPASIRVEAAVQDGLASQGFPAPRVVLTEDNLDVLGRRFMIMQRMPGRPAMLGTRPDRFLRALPRLMVSWPANLAAIAVRLHGCATERITSEAAARGLAPTQLGWDRHLRLLDDGSILRSSPGWSEGLDWLRSHLPPPPGAPVVVHGDLWAANALFEKGRRFSGLVDWERTTLGERELDIGFAKVGWALMPAPSVVPPPIYQALNLMGRWMAERIETEYRSLAPLDRERVRYYEALRCALELAAVVDRPLQADQSGAPAGWRHGRRALARHFRRLTGIKLDTGRMSSKRSAGADTWS